MTFAWYHPNYYKKIKEKQKMSRDNPLERIEQLRKETKSKKRLSLYLSSLTLKI